jgi:hypothetical protein
MIFKIGTSFQTAPGQADAFLKFCKWWMEVNSFKGGISGSEEHGDVRLAILIEAENFEEAWQEWQTQLSFLLEDSGKEEIILPSVRAHNKEPKWLNDMLEYLKPEEK